MSKRKKYPIRWAYQWFSIRTYNRLGLFRRRTFLVFATTHKTAEKKLLKAYPNARLLSIGPLGDSYD